MKDLILGAHVFFIPEGTLIDGTPASENAKPDTDPQTNWSDYKCGSVENFQPQSSATRLERFAPNRGKFTLRKTLATQRKLTLNIGLQEWDPRMLALLLGSEAPAVNGLIIPNSLGDDPRGWLKIQAYDQNDDLIFAADLWCEIRIESYQFQNSLSPYTLVASVLSSDLNAGEILNLLPGD